MSAHSHSHRCLVCWINSLPKSAALLLLVASGSVGSLVALLFPWRVVCGILIVLFCALISAVIVLYQAIRGLV